MTSGMATAILVIGIANLLYASGVWSRIERTRQPDSQPDGVRVILSPYQVSYWKKWVELDRQMNTDDSATDLVAKLVDAAEAGKSEVRI